MARRMITEVDNYHFTPDSLRIGNRLEGLSAFVRVRNGEDFLAEAICSHINSFDEIVIVLNQCTDGTEHIVKNLITEYPDKIKAYHYVDRVYPPGHSIYKKLEQNSPNSIGTYYNFALAMTTRTVVTKLDDDHIAIPQNLNRIVKEIETRNYEISNEMLCFSGLNLISNGFEIGVYRDNPFGGNGDHGFFRVTTETYFSHSEKFERFNYKSVKRNFYGMTYLHMKYLKKGNGFDNYELERDRNSRYRRHIHKFMKNQSSISLERLIEETRPHLLYKLKLPLLPGKIEFKSKRAEQIEFQLDQVDIEEILADAKNCGRQFRA